MVILTERLQRIADYIQHGEIIADIGTDHGYIPIYLFERGICNKAIACDINIGPIQIAKENIRRNLGENARIEVRMGSGLETLAQGEADVAVIAGMGGKLMIDILNKDIEITKSFKRIILQPRNAQDKLRKWLNENGFCIEDESLVREGKYFWEVIVAAQGQEDISWEIYYEIGRLLIENKDPYLKEYLERKIALEEKIIKNTQLSNREEALKRSDAAKEKLKMLKEVKEYVNQ